MGKKSKRTTAPRNPTTARDIDRWLSRATDHLIAGDYQGVIAAAQRALRAPGVSNEQRVQALQGMGAAYAMQDQHDLCYAVVSEALEIAPDDAMLWFNRGMAARYTMRLGQSLRDLERAQALDTAGLLADKLAAEIPPAREFAERDRALRGDDFTLDQLIVQEDRFQQAVLLMEQRRWQEAEPIFREVVAMGDVLPQPHGNLGLCLMMQRRFDEAEAALRRAIAIDPGYAVARQNLAALPVIRATGKLPPMQMSKPLAGRPIKRTLSLLVEGESQFRELS